MEQVFVNVNPRSTLMLGQARGAAICTAVLNNLVVAEYTALQIKQAVVGKGHAKKEQVQEMVKRLLQLGGNPSTDAADALACAICHAHGGLGLGRHFYGGLPHEARTIGMIGRITGLLLEKIPPLVLVDVRGVGYEIDVPMSTFYNLPAIGTEIVLHTHLVVREDVHLLFGFATEAERSVFRQLVKISGVGARTALALLSGLSVADLHQAVVAQDSGRLIKIPGVGKKTAERLLLELRDKLGTGAIGASEAAGGVRVASSGSDVLNALLSLGYNDREASWAIKQLPADLNVADGIRQALKILSKEK